MRSKLSVAAVAAALSVVAGPMVTPAAAAPPHDGCPVGPRPLEAGPGPLGEWMGWTLWSIEDLAAASVGQFPGTIEQLEQHLASLDDNGDGQVCAMKQVLPNDASGATTWWLPMDNRSNAS